MTQDIFTFKQFKVDQSRCAMKIGTDSVLLGSWTRLSEFTSSVLDIGAGTGILSLMLAQRCPAEIIDAVEIDPQSHAQCVENFENSDWADRLFCYHASFDEFYQEIDDTYEVIIANPPFFENHFNSGDPKRDTARFNDVLPYETLIYGVSKLLSKKGRFNVVIPFDQKTRFHEISRAHGLFPSRILNVKGTPNSPFKRCLVEYSFNEESIDENSLVIEVSRHNYTPEYTALTKNFYLKM